MYSCLYFYQIQNNAFKATNYKTQLNTYFHDNYKVTIKWYNIEIEMC